MKNHELLYIFDDLVVVAIGDAYKPAEDTWLIYTYLTDLRARAHTCVDMGSGTGILGARVLKNGSAKRCVFLDVLGDALESTRRTLAANNLSSRGLVVSSDGDFLRERSVELVVSNPPYLPAHGRMVEDVATEGGPRGHETIEFFTRLASSALHPGGLYVLLYSSLSGEEEVRRILQEKGFTCSVKNYKKLFFETLYLAECVRNED